MDTDTREHALGVSHPLRPGPAAVRFGTWRSILGPLGIALAAITLTSGRTWAETPLQSSASGAALFARHCASCHGAEGRGDGPARVWLKSQPRDLRPSFLEKYPRATLVQRLLDGRALAIELDPEAFRQRARDTEAVVAYLHRLPTLNWTDLDRGWDLYGRRCAGCHGPYGVAVGTVPDGVGAVRDLSDPAFQRETADAELVTAIRHGRRGMPALVPPIEPEQATTLLPFVRLLSRGFEVYDQTCTNCHGDRGRGVGSLGEERPLPTMVFDAAYFERADRDKLRVDVWHMLSEQRPQMPHFAPELSSRDAERIIDHLLAHRTARPSR